MLYMAYWMCLFDCTGFSVANDSFTCSVIRHSNGGTLTHSTGSRVPFQPSSMFYFDSTTYTE